jgi:hypothetical protein
MSATENITTNSETNEEWERANPHATRCRHIWPDGFRCSGRVEEIHEIKPERVWTSRRGAWSEGRADTTYYRFVCSQYGVHDDLNGLGENGTTYPYAKLPAQLREHILSKIGSAR